ncbi:hypothetical protein NIES2100_14420 [Calothrix sp. NIES-2100]|nr:hypothetical protein NIES2100_14420 [Calothrix sp. NIES-2100]
MNFYDWLNLVEATIQYIEREAQIKKTLEDRLSDKDLQLQQKEERIIFLQNQLTTASTALFADSLQLSELQDNFDRLSELVKPPNVKPPNENDAS